MEHKTISKWIEAAVSGDSTNEIARRAGVTVSTLHRQRTSGNYSPETVAKIARAYGRSAVNALVAHGVLMASDVAEIGAMESLADATDQQLLDEIASRLEVVSEGGGIFDEPNPVVHLHAHTEPEDQEAAAHDLSEDHGYDTNYDD
ncbi:hypothetical protein ACXR2T_10820 [Leucobacter sp. HY1910]